MELKCATPAELKQWEGDGALVRQALSAQRISSRERLFCLDAKREWCVEQRKAGKCIRSGREFRDLCIADQRVQSMGRLG